MKKPTATTGFWALQLVAVFGIMYMMLSWDGEADSIQGAKALDSAEQEIRTTVARARDLALATRAEHGVVFDAIGDRISVVQQGGTLAVDRRTGRVHQVFFGRPGSYEDVDILGADFGARGPVVTFDGQGNAIAGGSLTLRIRGSDRILVFDQATGTFVR